MSDHPPCKQCISYAMCINKKEVVCTALYKLCYYAFPKFHTEVKKLLPNASIVAHEDELSWLELCGEKPKLVKDLSYK